MTGGSLPRQAAQRASDRSVSPRRSNRRSHEDVIDDEPELKMSKRQRSEEVLESSRGSRSTSKVTKIRAETVDPDDPEELAKFLGFGSFSSTKGRKVPGNHPGAAHVKRKRREYSQMLHRKNLYEIPLTRQQLEEKEATEQNKMQT